MPDTPDPTALDLLTDASQRLVRTVDGLVGDAWSSPSLLPGWSRAHVVAHLALNAEGLAGALGGLVAGRDVPMYASDETRDDDIATLATADHDELRDRLLGSVTRFADAVDAVLADRWSASIERTPGGRTFRAADVVSMRLREVEIHHADLDAGYTHAAWPPEFAIDLVTAMAARDDRADGLVLVATDLDRSWTIGDGGPAVTGPVTALAWWITGRGEGAGLTSDGGALPRMGAW